MDNMTVGKIEFGLGYNAPMRSAASEIASRIAAAQRGKEEGYTTVMPPSEWSSLLASRRRPIVMTARRYVILAWLSHCASPNTRWTAC